MQTKRPVIIVGTSTELKLRAVRKAFPGFDVIGVSGFVSAVREQPVGVEETLTGAKHRAHSARKSAAQLPFMSIGIENGAVKRGDKWVDVAAIVLLVEQPPSSQPTEHTIWSEEIQIPEENLRECLCKNGEDMFTEWSELVDPHIEITGGKKSRVEFLAEALLKWKPEHFKSM